MLRIRNRTPYDVALFPYQDLDGRDHAAAVIKGTYRIKPGQSVPAVADEQVPIRHGPKHAGEPGVSSVLFESDMWPPKPATDVVLVGHAHAPSAVESIDVTLRLGALHKTVRVFGDRAYFSATGTLGMTSPRPFTSMPLVYERAFGGADKSSPDPKDHAFEERNHVGVGFFAKTSQKRVDGERVPNLEDPRHLIAGPRDRPPPACFGFVSPEWSPRCRFVGTYDQRWREERCPLMPLDFDRRFLQAAHPELVVPYLRGGEQVSATHVVRGGGALSFTLPRRQLRVSATIKHGKLEAQAALDTVLIEPDSERLQLTWRATIPCGRDFLYIDELRVEET